MPTITLTKRGCTLKRNPTDPKLYSENAVTHLMKTLLIDAGVQVHRVRGPQGLTACTQILRLEDRLMPSDVWHERYAIESASEAYNQGEVYYRRDYDYRG